MYNRFDRTVQAIARAQGGNKMPGPDRYALLRRVPLFAELEESELVRLARDLHRCSYAAGQTIFFQGDPGDALYLIETGRVRIYVQTEEGQEVSMTFYGPGDILGELALLDREPRSATAMAVEDSVLLAMSSADLARHLRASYQLALNLMLILSRKLRQTTGAVTSMASLDVNRRTVQKLLQLAEQEGQVTPEGISVRSRLTQGELASLIGASRESVNRALRALVRKGLVSISGSQIILLKPQELARLVEGE